MEILIHPLERFRYLCGLGVETQNRRTAILCCASRSGAGTQIRLPTQGRSGFQSGVGIPIRQPAPTGRAGEHARYLSCWRLRSFWQKVALSSWPLRWCKTLESSYSISPSWFEMPPLAASRQDTHILRKVELFLFGDRKARFSFGRPRYCLYLRAATQRKAETCALETDNKAVRRASAWH